MKNRIVVTINDYERLMGLVECAGLRTKKPSPLDKLYKNLLSAEMFPQEKIDRKVITMNSRVKLKELATQRETEICITYPQDAEPRERRVSVTSEIGVALLGRKENEIASWKVPNGMGLFEIVQVTYQPEAAGDYDL